MLVVPWSHDQPDNADRLHRLGVARVLNRKSYTAANAARELDALLHQPKYADAARRMQSALLEEDGVRAAADAVEKTLRTTNP